MESLRADLATLRSVPPHYDEEGVDPSQSHRIPGLEQEVDLSENADEGEGEEKEEGDGVSEEGVFL